MNNFGGILMILFWSYFIWKFFAIFFPKRTKRRKDFFDQEKLNSWLLNDEARFSKLHVYPEDWGMRRQYIAQRNNFTCEVCGSKGWLGFHIHHIKPLSNGGTNELENLKYLCARCHENKHPHMVLERERKEREKEDIRKKAYWKRYWAKKRSMS